MNDAPVITLVTRRPLGGIGSRSLSTCTFHLRVCGTFVGASKRSRTKRASGGDEIQHRYLQADERRWLRLAGVNYSAACSGAAVVPCRGVLCDGRGRADRSRRPYSTEFLSAGAQPGRSSDAPRRTRRLRTTGSDHDRRYLSTRWRVSAMSHRISITSPVSKRMD